MSYATAASIAGADCLLGACSHFSDTLLVVNDVHSQLNRTRVASILTPATEHVAREIVRRARVDGASVCIAGGRHAMRGQQFGTDGLLIDTRALNRVLAFDAEQGLITVEGGIQWPDLLAYLNREQEGRAGRAGQAEKVRTWGIVQKQTGADRLSIAGALSCNAHGRGLNLGPIIQQVERIEIIGPDGEVRSCSRTLRPELFRLAIGGYGLFGIISRVELRLAPRVKVQRIVEIRETAEIADVFEQRVRNGYLYGDYQFAIDHECDSFLRRGVFSCYRPVPDEAPLTPHPVAFTAGDWARLLYYAHWDKRRAFDEYSSRYLQTSGQIYWADEQLSAAYVDNYHDDLDRAAGATVKATEMISELYVPRPQLSAFIEDARVALRRRKANVIYGTVRIIEKDAESFLAWARDRFACIVFNLHVEHTPRAIDAAAVAFRDLIDLAIAHGGSYYLTYHRWARKDQVDACYPQMREFLRLLTFLLGLRVLGQLAVVLWRPRWLPPMEQWQSGLLRYRVLLPSQIVVLTLMSWAAADFFRGAGVFVEPTWKAAWSIVWFSYVYAGAMLVRYVIRMAKWPDERWLGGTIPIVFHCDVAAFLWVFGSYHNYHT